MFLYLQSLYFTIVHSRNELVIISIIGIRQMLSLNIHHKNYLLYCNIIINNYHYIFNTCIYYYLLSSITAVTVYSVIPPNSIIQLVVGVTLHTERECQCLLETLTGRLFYKIKMIIVNLCMTY